MPDLPSDPPDHAQPPIPVTAEDLIPAMVELASIQMDLLGALRIAPGDALLKTPPSLETERRLLSVRATGLQVRTREVLEWLLARTRQGT